MLRSLDQLMERKEDGGMYFIWVPLIGDVRTLIMDEAHALRYLVHPGADKTYYDLRDIYGGHKALGTRLDMSTTYNPYIDGQIFDVLHLKHCKEGNVGRPFCGLKLEKAAYRLRLIEELSSVHDTFHVSNLKKRLADANLHVPLDEIKVDKTLRFVEEPIEIIDRKVKSLKRNKFQSLRFVGSQSLALSLRGNVRTIRKLRGDTVTTVT
nr:putative reverse transcriptase domain-containing protein [Tanacetum cinerariifolium]